MRIILLLLLLFSPFTAAAQGLDAAKQDGAILLMRHAIAPGGGDPANFDLADCSTQRNLSDEGRAQARQIGQRLKDGGIEITRVFTSQWCRCRETAELLGLGAVQEWPSLNSFFRDRSTEPQQTAETIRLLSQLDASEKPILVTHQVNITALTGVVPRSGEIIVVALDGQTVQVLSRIPPP